MWPECDRFVWAGHMRWNFSVDVNVIFLSLRRLILSNLETQALFKRDLPGGAQKPLKSGTQIFSHAYYITPERDFSCLAQCSALPEAAVPAGVLLVCRQVMRPTQRTETLVYTTNGEREKERKGAIPGQTEVSAPASVVREEDPGNQPHGASK